MRQLLASLLLLCVGLSLPAAGAPLCLCFVDLIQCDSSCCDEPCQDCSEDCPKIERLPEAPAPGPATELPPVPVLDLADAPGNPMISSSPWVAERVDLSDPIRGPDPGPPLRVMLAIWRL